MKVIKLDIIDWEPATLAFVFPDKHLPPVDQFKTYVDGWLHRMRADSGICGCKYRYAEFSSIREQRRHIVRTEWMCEKCASALARAVRAKFPMLEEVELGVRTKAREQVTPQLIQVPRKTVEFEDGIRVEVEPFEIAKRPVTVGQYEQFARMTGYVTRAELQKSPETFRDHFSLEGLAESLQNDVPAQFVTHADAEAFCRHSGYRLPTEAEWLAAGVTEMHEIELSPLEELQRRARPIPEHWLEVNTWDITATALEDGDSNTSRAGSLFDAWLATSTPARL